MADYRQHSQSVYERDGWICKLCGLPVAKDRTTPHPLAPTLDHIHPRIKGGTGDPANLQTAHSRCNSSKCDRGARGPFRAVITIPPSPERSELLARLRTLVPSAESRVGTPLAEVGPEDIGDVFDRARGLAHTAQLSALPDTSTAVAWVEGQLFLSRQEALTAVREQLTRRIDAKLIAESLAESLRKHLPQSWFVLRFLDWGDDPKSADDETGWTNAAYALLDYVGEDDADQLVESVVEEVLFREGDVLKRLEQVLSEPRGQDPVGWIHGHECWYFGEAVTALQKANRLQEAESLLEEILDAVEAERSESGRPPSPGCYQELATVRRRLGNTAGEIEALERYFAQLGPEDTPSSGAAERLEAARKRLAE